jgi:hypothetical protein
MNVIKFALDIEDLQKMASNQMNQGEMLVKLLPIVNKALDYIGDCIVAENPDFPKEEFLQLDIKDFMDFLKILFQSHSFNETKKKFQEMLNQRTDQKEI